MTIGSSLLFVVSIALTTCQFQFNNAGNGITLRILVPGKLSNGAKTVAAATSPRSLAHGDSVTVTITQQGATGGVQQTLPVGEKASLDFSFSLSSSGSYSVSAVMQDASGNILAQATTQFDVPTGNYPIVLPMYSNLLYDAVITDPTYGVEQLYDALGYPIAFSPMTYSYSADLSNALTSPATLTLMTVDPNAIISVTENISGTNYVDSHMGSVYTLSYNGTANSLVTIVVTGQNGAMQTYTVELYYPS